MAREIVAYSRDRAAKANEARRKSADWNLKIQYWEKVVQIFEAGPLSDADHEAVKHHFQRLMPGRRGRRVRKDASAAQVGAYMYQVGRLMLLERIGKEQSVPKRRLPKLRLRSEKPHLIKVALDLTIAASAEFASLKAADIEEQVDHKLSEARETFVYHEMASAIAKLPARVGAIPLSPRK